MSQKYKIFINDKLLFLVQNPAEVSEILSSDMQFIIQPFKNKKQLRGLLEILMGNINPSSMVIYHSKLEKLKEAIISEFVYIEAAGGVVRNEAGQILLIFRRGFWDLPKGKQEKKETLEKTAVREVKEETGIRNVKLINAVTYPGLSNECTYHTYVHKDENVLKASYWYNMETEHTGKLIPQAEEDIEQAIWVNESDLEEYFPTMYPSVIDVLGASTAPEKIESNLPSGIESPE